MINYLDNEGVKKLSELVNNDIKSVENSIELVNNRVDSLSGCELDRYDLSPRSMSLIMLRNLVKSKFILYHSDKMIIYSEFDTSSSDKYGSLVVYRNSNFSEYKKEPEITYVSVFNFYNPMLYSIDEDYVHIFREDNASYFSKIFGVYDNTFKSFDTKSYLSNLNSYYFFRTSTYGAYAYLKKDISSWFSLSDIFGEETVIPIRHYNCNDLDINYAYFSNNSGKIYKIKNFGQSDYEKIEYTFNPTEEYSSFVGVDYIYNSGTVSRNIYIPVLSYAVDGKIYALRVYNKSSSYYKVDLIVYELDDASLSFKICGYLSDILNSYDYDVNYDYAYKMIRLDNKHGLYSFKIYNNNYYFRFFAGFSTLYCKDGKFFSIGDFDADVLYNGKTLELPTVSNNYNIYTAKEVKL